MPDITAKTATVAPHAGLRIPEHLGVIMDGNRRWAQVQGKPRSDGHREGIKALRRLVEYSIRYGVPYLTVFSFSSENWRREKSEIEFIFKLMRTFVDSDLGKLKDNNVRIRILGERKELDPGLQKIITRVEVETRENTGLNLNVAFNYGGRAEIVTTAGRIVQFVREGRIGPEEIDEELFSRMMLTGGMPDPDLLIRTGGESRISNFLIWQSAYAELVFLDEFWPDFDEPLFVRALEMFSRRQRRFGGDGGG
ncbi:MAG TPA: di-trans,poly-cis-decaprenylcistransferase [Devosia sp.]|nr:di-trans,poly-cis-decaprenylcistransferase [Devosia sp.]